MAARETPGLVRRLMERLSRSQHVFLLGLLVAFAVEVVVDWNSTFYEINVLRTGLRDKAIHYATMTRLAAREALAAGDKARLARLAGELLEDDEVVAVRFTDARGALLVEAGAPIAARYPHQIERDEKAMLSEPAALRRAVARSRHRDIFQVITDGEDRLVRGLTGAAPPPPARIEEAAAYQDRLYDEKTRAQDRDHVWALSLVQGEGEGRIVGVALIAMSTERLRRAVARKLWKGAAVTVFFLGFILYQQVSSRRAKLRMLSMADALAAARAALDATLPDAPPEVAGLDGALAFEQAERLGGTVYDFHTDNAAPGRLDIFVALPEGSGVDVAFASLLVRDQHRQLRRQRCATGATVDPEPLLGALAAAYAEEPIHRRLELAFYCVDVPAGEVRGVLAGAAPPVVLAGGEALPVERSTIDPALAGGAPIEGPIERFRVAFPPGAVLLVFHDGLPAAAAHPLPLEGAVSEARERLRAGKSPSEIAGALRDRVLSRGPLGDDLFVLVLRRAAVG